MIQKNSLVLAAAAMVIALGSHSPASAVTLKGETASPGCPYTVFIMTAKYASKAGINIQVSDGKTLTKSMLLMGQEKLDIASTVPAANVFMSKGVAMYKKLGKKAVALHKKLRGMFSYQCGLYNMVVWDEGPIKTWKDLKGKKIFTGPPSGAAAKMSEDYIKAMTGFTPNKEYTAVRLNWGGGQDAMRNGQLDGYMRPLTVPSALMDELTSIRPVRILGIDDDQVDNPLLKKLLSVPGRSMGVLKVGEYKRVTNLTKDIRSPAYALSQSVGVHVPEDVVYKITKAFWSNIGEIHKNTPYLSGMTLKTALQKLKAPLHMGAYKYYKEQGVTIPKGLLPPEL